MESDDDDVDEAAAAARSAAFWAGVAALANRDVECPHSSAMVSGAQLRDEPPTGDEVRRCVWCGEEMDLW